MFDLNTLHSKSGVVQSAIYLIRKVAFELDSLLLMIFSSKKTPVFSIEDIGSSSGYYFYALLIPQVKNPPGIALGKDGIW